MSETDSSPAPERAFKKRLPILLLILLAGVGMMVWWADGFNREPLHKVKPISYWVDRACTGYDANEVWEFRREVKNIGPTAVPDLVSKLRTSDWWRSAWLGLRARLPARVQQRFPDTRSAAEIRHGAARALAMIGPDAKPAVRDLARLLPSMNYPVIDALAAIGPNAKEALPGLHALLTNQNASLRVEVARALWFIGRETNVVLQICTNAMVPGTGDGEAINACFLLSRLGAAAASAVPFALNLLQNTNYSPDTRANAASVLGAARASSPEIRATLLDGTKTDEAHILRSNCAMALWRLDSQYALLATRLVLENIIAMEKRFPRNNQDFTLWLESHGLDASESIPALKQLLESDSAEMRKEAAVALEKIEAKAEGGARQ